MNRVHALCLLGCALAGCAGLPSPFGDIEESRQVVELVGYTQKVAELDPAQQRRAFESSRRLVASDPGAYARVRLALLLALPGTAPHSMTTPGLWDCSIRWPPKPAPCPVRCDS